MSNKCGNKCYTNSSSYIYDGGNLECSGAIKGEMLNLVLAKLDAAICAGITNPIHLVGDVTGVGTYTVPTTLATVNSNVGTFGDATHVAQVTVNAKGLVTAVSNVAITGGGGGTITLAPIGSSPNANAATITGSVLNLQPASSTFGGVVTTSTQTISGAKTLTDLFTLDISSISGREYLMKTFISDAGNDQFGIANSTSIGSRYNPVFYGYLSNTQDASAMSMRALLSPANDTGTVAAISISASITSSDGDPNNGTFTALTTKPVLTIGSGGNIYAKVAADGSSTFYNTVSVISSASTLFSAYAGVTQRTVLSNLGIQVWTLNNGATEVGTIAYTTPIGTPGIVFSNTSGTGRSQIRQFESTGGLAFGSETTGTAFSGGAMILTNAGELFLTGDQTTTSVTSVGKVLNVEGDSIFNGSVKIVDGTQAAGYVFTTDAFGNGSWQAASGGTNIYNSDGTLTGNRIANIGGFDFTIQNTPTVGAGSPLLNFDMAAQKYYFGSSGNGGFDGMVVNGANGVSDESTQIFYTGSKIASFGEDGGNVAGIDLLSSVFVGFSGTSESSAILQVSSQTKGVLDPRMTIAQRDLISSPATGLRIYQTDNTPGFYYYNGTAWIAIGTGTGLAGSATLDFGSIASLGNASLTITVTGAADGDPVDLGVPNGSMTAGLIFTAWVSAANTVSVQCYNSTLGAIDPASGTFKVFVKKN